MYSVRIVSHSLNRRETRQLSHILLPEKSLEKVHLLHTSRKVFFLRSVLNDRDDEFIEVAQSSSHSTDSHAFDHFLMRYPELLAGPEESCHDRMLGVSLSSSRGETR